MDSVLMVATPRLACQCGTKKFHVTRKRDDAGRPDCRAEKRRPLHWKLSSPQSRVVADQIVESGKSSDRPLPVKDEMDEDRAGGEVAEVSSRALCSELEQLRGENAQLRVEHDSMSAHIADLMQAAATESAAVKQLIDEKAQLQTESESLRTRIKSLVSALSTANDKISVLQRESGIHLQW